MSDEKPVQAQIKGCLVEVGRLENGIKGATLELSPGVFLHLPLPLAVTRELAESLYRDVVVDMAFGVLPEPRGDEVIK